MSEAGELETADWRAIGRAVYQRRNELGMKSQQALAERADVHVNTVSRIERGVPSSRRNPTWGAIEAALQWPAGHIARLADGEQLEVAGNAAPTSLAAEIEQAVFAAISDNAPDVTVRQARQIAEGAVAELRRRGVLPSNTSGLTPGTLD